MSVPSTIRRVLFVTGAYAPEFSAGGLQCQAIARAIQGHAHISVLTTATTTNLPMHDDIEGVSVTRVHVEPGRSALQPLLAMTSALRRLLPRVDVVHVQGYSSKVIAVSAIATMFRKPVVVHLQTARHDEPGAVYAQGRMARWAFQSAAKFISVSPGLKASAIAGGIPPDRIVEVPNGVDTSRFSPVSAAGKRQARTLLGLPADRPLVLFVGLMMPDKQPDVLLQAWRRVEQQYQPGSTLVFVGATNATLFELGDRLGDRMQAQVAAWHVEDQVRLVAPTHKIEQYYQAADVVVLPSLREGLPNVVLEAMASGLPVIASRLPGSTDVVIEDGVSGRLVDPGDVDGFAKAIADVLLEPSRSAAMGAAARKVIEDRYDIRIVAEQWLAVYDQVLERA